MSVQVKRRRDTAANIAAFTPAQGELIIDTTNNRVIIGDGAKVGGWPAAKLSEVATASRTAVSDANYTALPADRLIAYAALTAPRVVSLPSASTFPTGAILIVADETGNCSPTLTITLSANGSDTIDGSASLVLASGYASSALESNGVGKWTVVYSNSQVSALGIGVAPSGNNQLIMSGSNALFTGANMNISLNKSVSANAAMFTFETGFSGRAQFGTIGSDDFFFQVSPDGSTWYDALHIASASGDVTFPAWIALHAAPSLGYFYKTNPTAPAFTVTGAGTISVNAGTVIDCAGVLTKYASATAVTMPSLSAGTDYVIYQCADGTIRADASFTAPSGYTTANSRQIGGFHYAPGGNGVAMAGGNTTPAINPYSVWDLKWRPRCVDPRGMALVAGRFWADIYLTNTATDANGSSRYGLPIANGAVPPKIPSAFGGDGSTAYTEFNWWDANETLASVGKRSLTTEEFQVAAYGTTEESSLSADPVTTGVSGGTYTSAWGLMQVTGAYWLWGRELGGPYSAASWTQSTGNRGQFYVMPSAVILGGVVGAGALSGSRASFWSHAASYSYGGIGARGCCDHLMLV